MTSWQITYNKSFLDKQLFELPLLDKNGGVILAKSKSRLWYNNHRFRGVAQLVARSVRDAEVACSSQVTPTKLKSNGLYANIACTNMCP